MHFNILNTYAAGDFKIDADTGVGLIGEIAIGEAIVDADCLVIVNDIFE